VLSNNTSEAYSYTTIRYLTDPDRNIDVPVGIVLCNTDQGRLFFRLPQEEERITNVPSATAKASLELAKTKIEHWLMTGNVPYAKQPLTPLSEAWWEQVRKLMQFRVRIGTIQPIDCQRPEEEVESLFEAVVKPQVSAQARAARVNGAVTRALGNQLASQMVYRKPVSGFRNRKISVLRHLEDARHLVVVDAVNLAATTAEEDTYALISKLRSIRYQNEGTNRGTSFVVGYLASPAGLNGEASLKDWFEQDAGVPMFDLTRQATVFRERVQDALAAVNDGLGVMQHNGSVAAGHG
jgi:hypothetical protein